MNENIKTSIFVAVAAVAVLAAVVTRPTTTGSNAESAVNQPLFPEFDPLSVTSLRIVEFDNQRGEVLPFQVAQANVKGKKRWAIPSHEDYPADAKDQVASAANGLIGLKILEVVSEDQGDQREYGVVDPDPKERKLGDTGVGTRVVMKDKNDKELLSLIVGKEVPGRPNLRYVRKVGQAPIYVVEAKTDKLSTKFENWIERNLLGINTMDVKMFWIRDYSVDEFNMALNQRGDMQIDYDDAGDPKWKMADDRKYVVDKDKQTGDWAPVKMAADEELNVAKLDELKSALDDLKIVNVSRKPSGLSADLKAAADFAKNREAIASLRNKGFFVAKLDDQIELFSNEGEIRIVMKDGVVYVLRFGEIAGADSSKKDDKKKDAKDGDGKDKKDGGGVERYLFVLTEYDPNIIPKPKLDPLPKDADKKADEKKTDDKKKSDDKKAGEAKKSDPAEREKIEKENKRKMEEYEQKVAEGKKRSAELNARFSDWYYVISNDVFRKIHLNRGDIVKKKEKAKEADKSQSKEAGGDAGRADGHDHAKGEKPADEPKKPEEAKKAAEPKKAEQPAAEVKDAKKAEPAEKPAK